MLLLCEYGTTVCVGVIYLMYSSPYIRQLYNVYPIAVYPTMCASILRSGTTE